MKDLRHHKSDVMGMSCLPHGLGQNDPQGKVWEGQAKDVAPPLFYFP